MFPLSDDRGAIFNKRFYFNSFEFDIVSHLDVGGNLADT